ncbi:MAG: cytochrome b/b6 domain-containing protein [Alphaproteobacteria bacterium]|nr:cytochrome b/b6 domain-containing protein [Alphaproteobacteria bacterium]MDA8013216.1 cytochrome b/b6 domain-containing protein [Alphaproteobacteria bacterium]
MNTAKKPKTWDLPTRITHWALAILVIAAFISGDGIADTPTNTEWGRNLQIHRIIAVCIVGLLIFRLVWGFIGNAQAKFKNFPLSPIKLAQDLANLATPGSHAKPKHYPGHTPAGAWATIAILVFVAVQVGTGLLNFNTDDNIYGPLARLVPQNVNNNAKWIHEKLGELFPTIILLHLAAVFWHEIVKGHKIITAMFTGRRPVQNDVQWQPERPKRAVITAAVSVIVVIILFLI